MPDDPFADLGDPLQLSDGQLVDAIEEMWLLLVAVSTGIRDGRKAGQQFADLYDSVSRECKRRKLEVKLPFERLSTWTARWSRGDLPTYESRREYLSKIFPPMMDAVRESLRNTSEGLSPGTKEETASSVVASVASEQEDHSTGTDQRADFYLQERVLIRGFSPATSTRYRVEIGRQRLDIQPASLVLLVALVVELQKRAAGGWVTVDSLRAIGALPERPPVPVSSETLSPCNY